MKFLTLLFSILSLATYGQVTEMKKVTFDNGLTFKRGDTVTIRKGTSKSEYSTFYTMKSFSGKKIPMTSPETGKVAIKKIQRHGEGDNSKIVFAFEIDDTKYFCEAERAIISDELIVPSKFKNNLRYRFEKSHIPIKDGMPFYEEVTEVGEQYKKDQLYRAAKQVLITNFKDAKEVIQDEDRENGSIVGKGFSEFIFNGVMGSYLECRMWFIIEISVKDGKYRTRIYNHSLEQKYLGSVLAVEKYPTYSPIKFASYYDDGKHFKNQSYNFLKAFHAENMSTLYSFQTQILSNVIEKSNDNW